MTSQSTPLGACLAILTLVTANPSWGAWIGACPGASSGKVLEQYLSTEGRTESLVLADRPQPGCSGVSIDFAAEGVQWARLVGPAAASEFAKGIMLKGELRDGRLNVAEIAASPEPASPPGGTPPGAELLALARVAAFGVEERAEVRAASGGVALQCRAGTAPAGATLIVPPVDPPGARLAVRIAHRAQGTFSWGASDAPRAARGDPLMLGSSQGNRETTLALPAALSFPTGSYTFTVACPRDAGSIEIGSLKLNPVPATVPRRAFWAWRPEAWMTTPSRLLDRAGRLGAGTIYITVPVSPDSPAVAQPAALRDFVAQASARNIEVWAAAGDPRAVIPGERPAQVRHARAYAAYNREASATSRLAGVQWDIEPYLNPGYHLDVDGWLGAYLDTLEELKRETSVPLEVAVPFWWAGQQVHGASLLDRLVPLVDSVAVMNYRTEPSLIRRFADPFLAWGARHARRVRIALESGPIPDEVARHYRPAASGSLLLVPHAERFMLVLVNGSAPNPAGPAYAFSHQTRAPGSAVTFRGRWHMLEALLPGLESTWSAWPAFAGVALHEPDAD